MEWRPYLATFRYARIKGSRLHGRGLFAWRNVPAGAPIIEYLGRRMTKKQSEELTNGQWEEGLVYTFSLNKRYDLDGNVWWNRARRANHSCGPNAEAQKRGAEIWIVALRAIARGEEITYDYNFPADGELHECLCKTPQCSGYVVGKSSRGALANRLKRQKSSMSS